MNSKKEKYLENNHFDSDNFLEETTKIEIKDAKSKNRLAFDIDNGSVSVTKIKRGPQGARGKMRSKIMAAARYELLTNGYETTTMRKIAKRAGCNPAMIGYYFDSKQLLLRKSFNLPDNPVSQVVSLLSPNLTNAGERLLYFGFNLLEKDITSESLKAVMPVMIGDPATRRRFRNYIKEELIIPVSKYFGYSAEIAIQLELAFSLFYGIVSTRYVIQLEPLASMPLKDLINRTSPLVQSHINKIAELVSTKFK